MHRVRFPGFPASITCIQVFTDRDLPSCHRPHGLLADKSGKVRVNEVNTDTVVPFDPTSEQMRAIKLPSNHVGFRNRVTDAGGRLRYMGGHNGTLGVIERSSRRRARRYNGGIMEQEKLEW
jgi:streptogramin lyase